MPPKPQFLGAEPHENRETLTAARRFEIFRWFQGKIANRGRAIRWYNFCPPKCPPNSNFGGQTPTKNGETLTAARRFEIFRWYQGVLANRGRAIRWYKFCPSKYPQTPIFGGKPHDNRETLTAARRRLKIETRTQRCYSKPKAGYPIGLLNSRLVKWNRLSPVIYITLRYMDLATFNYIVLL